MSNLRPYMTGWDGPPPEGIVDSLVGVDLEGSRKAKVSIVQVGRSGVDSQIIGYTIRLHNKKGPQIRPWRGALEVDGKWLILGPFELNAKKIEDGATRSASGDAEIKAMKAVFEAWRDHQ